MRVTLFETALTLSLASIDSIALPVAPQRHVGQPDQTLETFKIRVQNILLAAHFNVSQALATRSVKGSRDCQIVVPNNKPTTMQWTCSRDLKFLSLVELNYPGSFATLNGS
jgi:hypothetical protein